MPFIPESAAQFAEAAADRRPRFVRSPSRWYWRPSRGQHVRDFATLRKAAARLWWLDTRAEGACPQVDAGVARLFLTGGQCRRDNVPTQGLTQATGPDLGGPTHGDGDGSYPQ
jgi:hypothetical protein